MAFIIAMPGAVVQIDPSPNCSTNQFLGLFDKPFAVGWRANNSAESCARVMVVSETRGSECRSHDFAVERFVVTGGMFTGRT